MRRFLWPILLLPAGCALPPAQAPTTPVRETPSPAASLQPSETWNIVSSRLEVRVYRDGPMQKLGHTHFITSDALEGTVALREPLAKSGFDLRLPLESLVVDDPVARSGAGADFANPVPEKDREATRHNMLGEAVLDAEKQPVLRLTADELAGRPGRYEARVHVGLRGEERVVSVPFTLTIVDGRLSAHAEFQLTHAELGLVPFSVALGALRVRDDFGVDLRIEARPAT